MFIPIGHLQVSTMLLTPPKESAIHQECIFFSVETTEKNVPSERDCSIDGQVDAGTTVELDCSFQVRSFEAANQPVACPFDPQTPHKTRQSI